jgi:hypothetical protein
LVIEPQSGNIFYQITDYKYFTPIYSLSLFALMQKVTKKIKAVLKSYDFAKAPAARKKLAPPASGLKQFFA